MRLGLGPGVGARWMVLAMVVGAVAVSSDEPIGAQTQTWTSPYPMILTSERALAFVRAADRRLDYVPGEVLVRFKDGTAVTGQQRALMAVRSRPSVGDLQWTGGVALLRDSTELDATILA